MQGDIEMGEGGAGKGGRSVNPMHATPLARAPSEKVFREHLMKVSEDRNDVLCYPVSGTAVYPVYSGLLGLTL